MRENALSQYTGGHWNAIALIIFVVLFAGFVLWTYRRSARNYYKKMARLPLDDENRLDEEDRDER